jgi:hypothetical protein
MPDPGMSQDDVVDAARNLCRTKPTAKWAIRFLRTHRRGKKPVASAEGLVSELSRLLDDYRRRYPDATNELMRQALQNLYELLPE